MVSWTPLSDSFSLPGNVFGDDTGCGDCLPCSDCVLFLTGHGIQDPSREHEESRMGCGKTLLPGSRCSGHVRGLRTSLPAQSSEEKLPQNACS